ncbi:MAG: hypothetical protein WDZ35_07845 [Crocinitomicaceae bacterium]
MKTLRTVVSFFYAFLPFGAFVLAGIAVLDKVYSFWKYPISLSLLIIGFLLGRFLFNFMRRRGVLSTMTGDNASYDADDLKPLEHDEFRKLTPEKLEYNFKSNENLFKGGKIKIWGDWTGKKLDVYHEIQNVQYNSEKDTITIEFKYSCTLKIRKPIGIYESESYLKIRKAKEILWRTPDIVKSKNKDFCYMATSKKIITKSNTPWKPHKYDVGIGEFAIYIQG